MNFSGKSQFQLVAKPLQRDQRGFRRILTQVSLGKSISWPSADAKTLGFRASNWPRRMRCYDKRVNRRFHTFVSVAAILLIAVSQMCELFDRWDSIADIGHDSEFMFIVIGMCIAMCVLLALLIVKLARIFFSLVARLLRGVSPPAQPHTYGTDYLLLLFSPPLSFTSLRI